MPKFECFEYEKRKKDYVVLIPIINEGERIKKELQRAAKYKVSEYADIVICDGGSSDGCTEESKLKSLQVNTGCRQTGRSASNGHMVGFAAWV